MSRSPVALRRERDLQLTPVQQHGLRARLAGFGFGDLTANQGTVLLLDLPQLRKRVPR